MARRGHSSKFISRPEVKHALSMGSVMVSTWDITVRPRQPSRGNLKSALENPLVIGEHLRTECEAGGVIGPLDLSSYPQVHIS